MASRHRSRSQQIRWHGEDQFRLASTEPLGEDPGNLPSHGAAPHTPQAREHAKPWDVNVQVFNSNIGMSWKRPRQQPEMWSTPSYRRDITATQMSPPETPSSTSLSIPRCFSLPEWTPASSYPAQYTTNFELPPRVAAVASPPIHLSQNAFPTSPTGLSDSPTLFTSFNDSFLTPQHEPEQPALQSPFSPHRQSSSHSERSAGSSDHFIPRMRHPKKSYEQKVHKVLNILQEVRLCGLEFAALLLGLPLVSLVDYQTGAYNEDSPHIDNLLDAIWDDPRGRIRLTHWMRPHALDLICTAVSGEMEQAKKDQRMEHSAVTPDYIATWNVNNLIKPAATPVWTRILTAATNNLTAVAKNVSRTSEVCRNVVTAQVLYARSFASCKSQLGVGLFAWSTGASRQMIEVLGRCGLSVSYTSILGVLKSLGNTAIETVTDVVEEVPHSLTYDNVNISQSKFIEQHPDAPSKVQSGTFSVIYELHNARFEDMQLAPLMANLKASTDLTFGEITATRDQKSAYMAQAKVHIVRALTTHHAAFTPYATHSSLQHIPRRPLPSNLKTKYYPLRITTIEEASVKGNILVHDDVYLTQLKRDASANSRLVKTAVPMFADLLTLWRTRGAMHARDGDLNAWTRREIFQLGMGLFHLTMNLIWALLKKYRQTVGQLGTLNYYFVLLDKARLGSDKPDYHSLLSTLQQILDGLLLHAWKLECGYGSLDGFAQSKPSPERLLEIAERILRDYATPMEVSDQVPQPSTAQDDGSSDSDSVESEGGTDPAYCRNPADDVVNQNIRLLTRDLLYVQEVVRAVSDGDFVRVEDIFPDLARIFRGAGSNSYASEILHFLHNVKKVWTPEFANIMRDNMIVNVSGLPGHCMAIDLNIEHLIGYLKELLAAKGIYASWEQFGNISPCINHLMLLKKQVAKSLGTSYQGTTHKTPDTSKLVWRVFSDLERNKIQTFTANRAGNSTAKAVEDLLQRGHNLFKSPSLATFNKRMRTWIEGGEMQELEADEIEAVSFENILGDTTVDTQPE